MLKPIELRLPLASLLLHDTLSPTFFPVRFFFSALKPVKYRNFTNFLQKPVKRNRSKKMAK